MADTASAASNHRRQRILDATVAVLREGREVRVTEVAEMADVSTGLIYRYFGNREDLLAAAYVITSVGNVLTDAEMIEALVGGKSRSHAVDAVRTIYMDIFDAARHDVRWARLEALSHYRTNPQLSKRLAASRLSAIQSVTRSVVTAFQIHDPEALRQVDALALLTAAIPLGFTAIGGDEVESGHRWRVANLMALLVVRTLEDVGVSWPEETG